jgi:molecular chaperone GrpE (heat shock protein)
MDASTAWWLVGLAAVLGAVIVGWVVQRIARFRHGRAVLRATDALQKQNAALADQLRAAAARAHADLEQLRQAHKRQLQTAQAEPQAATARAEQRLVAAYEELDRLRRQVAGAANTEPSDLGDGFAATRPMRDGM